MHSINIARRNQDNLMANKQVDIPLKLEMQNISKSFFTRKGELPVLRNINLSVAQGDFISIVGPSGCGKSTLLYIAAGLDQPTGGAVLANGKLAGAPGPDRCLVFQQFALFPAMTVQSNIEYGLRLAGIPRTRRKQVVSAQIKSIGLNGFEDHYPSQLSGGMKQRVAIARSLALQPDILLMDEPFGSLDAQTRIIMQEEIASVCARENLTVLFVTHSVEEAIFLSNRVIVMTTRPGKIKEAIEIPKDADWMGKSVDQAYGNPSFNRLREHVWHSVREEITQTRKEG
jgi:NitT/TauT family transport system ATP-binding protein